MNYYINIEQFQKMMQRCNQRLNTNRISMFFNIEKSSGKQFVHVSYEIPINKYPTCIAILNLC